MPFKQRETYSGRGRRKPYDILDGAPTKEDMQEGVPLYSKVEGILKLFMKDNNGNVYNSSFGSGDDSSSSSNFRILGDPTLVGCEKETYESANDFIDINENGGTTGGMEFKMPGTPISVKLGVYYENMESQGAINNDPELMNTDIRFPNPFQSICYFVFTSPFNGSYSFGDIIHGVEKDTITKNVFRIWSQYVNLVQGVQYLAIGI